MGKPDNHVGDVLTVFPHGTEIIRDNIYSDNAEQRKLVAVMETSIIKQQYALAKEQGKL